MLEKTTDQTDHDHDHRENHSGWQQSRPKSLGGRVLWGVYLFLTTLSHTQAHTSSSSLCTSRTISARALGSKLFPRPYGATKHHVTLSHAT